MQHFDLFIDGEFVTWLLAPHIDLAQQAAEARFGGLGRVEIKPGVERTPGEYRDAGFVWH